MNDTGGRGLYGLNEPSRKIPNRDEPPFRVPEPPLSPEDRASSPRPQNMEDTRRRRTAAPPQERALTNTPPSREPPSNLQRAVSALRATLPIVHQLLPLLGGSIGAAVSNVMGPYPQTVPHTTPINIEPIEDDVAELQTQHRDLRNRLLEHHASLKRVEDQLETVREAGDRNAREQEELAEDLQKMRTTVHRFAMIALALLVVSLLLNVGMFLHILHVLPWL